MRVEAIRHVVALKPPPRAWTSFIPQTTRSRLTKADVHPLHVSSVSMR